MSQHFRLQLLGVPTLVAGTQSWVLPFERRTQLLVLLAQAGQWVGRREAGALLWPELPGPAVAANLRKTLFRVAQLPWGEALQADGGALRFVGSTDVEAFEAALREGRGRDALSLRQGELLTGFVDPANEGWTNWLGHERERLRGAWRAAALEWLDEVTAADGTPGPRTADALTLAAQLLEADPFDETALRAQMRVLARSGQVAAARQLHGDFTRRLAGELGLAPGAGLMALLAELEGPGSGAPAPAPPPRAPIRATGGALDESFIGRASELRRIASLLEQADCRLLTLSGPGGIGKTRLARRVLFELAPGFEQGGAFIALEDVTDAEGLAQRLLRAVAEEVPATAGDALSQVMAVLRERRQLLVLDNFEALVGQAGLLQLLLQACPGVKFLVTSRVRLALGGEWVLQMEGLPCPDAEDMDRVEAFDAVRLFTRSAQQVRPEWTPGPEAEQVATLCRLVEGLPLALELAAAWVRVLSCADIAAELRRGGELLHTTDGRHAARHASMEQVFEQSWQLLSETERDALARLTVFRGDFTAAAARAVTGAALAVLGALVDKSLLRKDESRLRLHPLVQQLAAERLPEPQRRDNAQAHAQYYLQRLTRLGPQVQAGDGATLRELDAEVDNAWAAWVHAARHGAAAIEGAAQDGAVLLLEHAARSLIRHAGFRGRRQESLAASGWAASSPAAMRHAGLRAMLLSIHADQQLVLGDVQAADATAAQALALAEGTGQADVLVQALISQAACAIRLGRLAPARSACERALALVEESREARARSYFLLDSLAMVDMLQGHYQQALHHALRALKEHRQRSNLGHLARSLGNIGNLQLITGDVDGAEAHLLEALALCERHGFAGAQGPVLINLSYVAEKRGVLGEAIRLAHRGLQMLEQTSDRTNVAAARLLLSQLQCRRGDLTAAATELVACAKMMLELGNPGLQLHALVACAHLLLAHGAPQAARALAEAVAADPHAVGPVQTEIEQLRASLPPAQDGARSAWAQSGLTLQDALRRLARDGAAGVDTLRGLLTPS